MEGGFTASMRNGAWLAAGLVALAVLTSCGKSRRTSEPDSSAGDTGNPSDGGAGRAGSSSGGSGATSGDECIVVRRLGCCKAPYAVHASELARDECLWPFDHLDVDGDRRDRCASTRPADCAPEPCTQAEPLSRVAAMDEEARCTLTDECDEASDCTFAAQVCNCCACGEPTPTKLVTDACIVTANDPNGVSSGAAACPNEFCLGCRHAEALSCSPTPGGLRRCEWGAEVPAEACSAERPCVGDFAGRTCYPPGVLQCGGPVMPDDCSTDADCAGTDQTLVCEMRCNHMRCVLACLTDADCLPAETCATDLRCHAKFCASDAECGPNFFCHDLGVCERRTCARSSNCDGTCVNGLCYDGPGTCQFPLL